jgi:hypothetical protein
MGDESRRQQRFIQGGEPSEREGTAMNESVFSLENFYVHVKCHFEAFGALFCSNRKTSTITACFCFYEKEGFGQGERGGEKHALPR